LREIIPFLELPQNALPDKQFERVKNREQMIEVTQAYRAQFSDPISFAAGETVEVGKADTEFPEWLWCRSSSGKEGWVHRSFLADLTGSTTGTQDYSARELSVTGGERGMTLESLGGWVYVQLESGEKGWLPQSHVRTIVP
jgi:hypothetical protein